MITDLCPDCDSPLVVRSSRRLTTSTVEQRRQCRCEGCGYRDVATLRLPKPEPIIVNIRVVESVCNTKAPSSSTKNNLLG